jgi:hypothetical protein
LQELFEVGMALGTVKKKLDVEACKVSALLQKIGVQPADLHLSSVEFQKKYGPILHQLTIKHMREGVGLVVNSLRGGAYSMHSNHQGYKAFVDSLAGDSVWANEAKAACAAEALGINLRVEYFPSSKTEQAASWDVYSCAKPDSLSFTVRNVANKHFYTSSPSDSVANGRCFENTLVEQMRIAALKFGLAPREAVAKAQEQVASPASLFAPKPGRRSAANNKKDDAAEKWQTVYNNTYNDAEREMCQRDYEFALRLAAGYDDVADQDYDITPLVGKRR